MRGGDKLESYRELANALSHLRRDDWNLLIVGDGPAMRTVKELFSHWPRQIHFLGLRERNFIHELMRACDLFVWPARNEAFGMAILESLACGLPVVAGKSGGVGDIVAHNATGILTAQNDPRAFAGAVETLLDAPAKLQKMSAASLEKFRRHHRLDSAAKTIGDTLARIAN